MLSFLAPATHQGEPLADLHVQFEPTEGNSYFAITDEDGSYTVRTSSGEDGILPGEYRVWVDHRPGEPDPEAPGPSPLPSSLRNVLKMYGEASSEAASDDYQRYVAVRFAT